MDVGLLCVYIGAHNADNSIHAMSPSQDEIDNYCLGKKYFIKSVSKNMAVF